jgi:hypothetical protein
MVAHAAVLAAVRIVRRVEVVVIPLVEAVVIPQAAGIRAAAEAGATIKSKILAIRTK